MKKKLIPLLLMLMVCTACTELAMLSSGATIAVSHNAYAKAYSGIDFLTIISTEKDIKKHVYETLTNDKKSND
jgi:Trk K+ transport system NAD-binding subunit